MVLFPQEAVTGDFGELVRLLLDNGGKIFDTKRGQVRLCTTRFPYYFWKHCADASVSHQVAWCPGTQPALPLCRLVLTKGHQALHACKSC